MAKTVADMLIIGGGLQGCITALFLARAGRRVVLIEKQLAGRHASGVNAGGVRLLMRDPREYPLSIRAMELWADLENLVGKEPARRSELLLGTSQVAVALTEADMQWAEARSAEMQALGYDNEEVIDRDELFRLVPHLNPNAIGGLISRGDGHANPANAARAFRNAAEAAGATILENCHLSELSQGAAGQWIARTSAGDFEAEIVVNATGAWGNQIAAMVDETLPLDVLAPSMMVTARVKPFVKPVVIGISRPLSFKQTVAGSLVIGGGILARPDLENNTTYTVMDRMTASAAATVEAFPFLAGVPVVRTWAGLEGKTPDNIPIIGPSTRHQGLWHVFGFCGHGFQLSPGVGELVANSLLSGSVDPRLAHFGPDRFLSGQAAPLPDALKRRQAAR